MQLGRYILHSLVGRGGQGEVWKAYDPALERFVAIKRTDQPLSKEAPIVASLNHPHIVPIYDIGQDGHGSFIAMQFIHGVELSKVKMTARQAARLMLDAASALSYAHAQGVIHRDLKPENLMVTSSGHLYVMDFGLSLKEGVTELLAGEIAGTPQYMSPQQANGLEATQSDDLYALGMSFRTCLSCHVPKRLQAILDRCTAYEREDRYQSASELVVDVERYLSRRKRFLMILNAAFVMLILIASWSYWTSERLTSQRAQVYVRTAQAMLDENQDARAIEAFTQAIALRPDALSYLGRGFCYWRLERYKEAVADCEEALRLDPSSEAAKQNLSMARTARRVRP